jgi:hypothetical protein
MRWLWLVGVVAALITMSACGGGGEKAAPALSDTDLKGISILTPDGLPFPVTLQTDQPFSNGEAARAFTDPQAWVNNFDKWGRTGGHMATYSAQGATGTAVQTQVESYKTVGGAKDAFSAISDFMRSPSALAGFTAQGYTNAKIDVLDANPIGEDSAAYRLDVSIDGKPFATLFIIFRRGPVLAQASVGTDPESTNTSDVEAVATQMDSRIQTMLGTTQPAAPTTN